MKLNMLPEKNWMDRVMPAPFTSFPQTSGFPLGATHTYLYAAVTSLHIACKKTVQINFNVKLFTFSFHYLLY